MGCLTLPFRFLGTILVIAALAVGWLYRDRLTTEVHRVFDSSPRSEARTATGRPGALALLSAKSKIDSLNGWRADSVVLTPSEVASLIGLGLEPALRQQLDSVQVQLGDGEVVMDAVLATARLPRELMGPLSIALRPRERVEAAGALAVAGPGRAEWTVRSFRIRDFPVPRNLVPRLVSRAFGDSTRHTIPVRIPAGIREIRVRPSGATLFGVPRP